MRSRSSNCPKSLHLQLFYLEQWIALVLGIACLGFSFWIAVQGSSAFCFVAHTRLTADFRLGIGWSLTFAAALIGLTLLRFAFYTLGEERAEPETKPGRSPMRARMEASAILDLVSRTGGKN